MFRCGANGLIRLNFDQTVDFYNNSVTNSEVEKVMEVNWTRADILLDWNEKTVKLYLNQELKSFEKFYKDNLENVNFLGLYNLKPGTVSFFQDLQVNLEIPEVKLSYVSITRAILGFCLIIKLFL